MASKKIQGIIIEIDGNTTKLGNALKDVDKIVYNTNAELKQLNQALKLDPSNTTLLSQKYEVLKTNVEASRERLEKLKEVQKQMGSYNKLTDEQKENYRALSVEIAKSENAIKNMTSQLSNIDKMAMAVKNVGDKFKDLADTVKHPKEKVEELKTNLKNIPTTALEKLKSSINSIDFSKVVDGLEKIKNVSVEVTKRMVEVGTAIGGALSGLVAAGVKSYASLEQNIGGVETLFKDSADKVVENAQKAYATAGISANEYMEQVTSFSASLLQSLGGDTEKAAKVADMALVDMADNANKMGTDMASIQNAYQGFAKQNYTMLDNLKLGYGGTKTEMERLLADAQKISGIEYNIDNLSDVYNAIHVIQEELGITGTTAKEATETISGSVTSMKAAFDNFLNGSGGVKEVAETVKNVLKNITNAITKLAPDILSGLVQLIQEILPEISTLIFGMLPTLFKAVTDTIQAVLDLIKENIEPLSETVISLVMSFVDFLVDNLPTIIEAGLLIIVALANGIAERLPELIPTIINTILFIYEILLDNLDVIIEAAFKLIIALAEGLIKALPQLALKIPEIIDKLVKGLLNGLSKIKDVGKELISGLWSGITEKWDNLKEKVANFGEGIVNKFKSVFGIHSPSKIMKEQIGENLGLGMVEGIEDTVSDVENAMKGLNYKVQTSINPIINPNAINKQLADSNSLINNTLSIDYNRLAIALAEQLSNVKVVMDDEPMAKFVVDTVTDEIYT